MFSGRKRKKKKKTIRKHVEKRRKVIIISHKLKNQSDTRIVRRGT